MFNARNAKVRIGGKVCEVKGWSVSQSREPVDTDEYKPLIEGVMSVSATIQLDDESFESPLLGAEFPLSVFTHEPGLLEPEDMLRHWPKSKHNRSYRRRLAYWRKRMFHVYHRWTIPNARVVRVDEGSVSIEAVPTVEKMP